MPDQRLAPTPKFCEIGEADACDALRRIRAEPRRCEQLCEFRRHHAIGRGHAGIAPVQVRHDQLQLTRGLRVEGHRKSSISMDFLYATLSIVASCRAAKPPLHPDPDSVALKRSGKR